MKAFEKGCVRLLCTQSVDDLAESKILITKRGKCFEISIKKKGGMGGVGWGKNTADLSL